MQILSLALPASMGCSSGSHTTTVRKVGSGGRPEIGKQARGHRAYIANRGDEIPNNRGSVTVYPPGSNGDVKPSDRRTACPVLYTCGDRRRAFDSHSNCISDAEADRGRDKKANFDAKSEFETDSHSESKAQSCPYPDAHSDLYSDRYLDP